MNKHSDVFLCRSGKKIRNNFQCMKFNDFIQADKYYEDNYLKNCKNCDKSTIISVCKYTPEFVKKWILNYKLKDLFWNDNIKIMKCPEPDSSLKDT